jgi:FAD/FMN-containing dehydrogenase
MDTTELERNVTGHVLKQGQPGYDDETATFNLAFRHTPDVVVAARSAGDVAAAVRWAGERSIPVGVQATGHGPTAPVTEGLLVSTRGMDQVQVDAAAGTARVAAGVKWRRLLDAAAEHGLAGLCGSTSDVGVVGYTLGGGLPVLGRTFGFCSDHVRGFEVVTGDGALHEVTVEDGSELSWALRGGKGNVGIVTSIELDLVPVTDIYGGGIFYRGEDVPAVLRLFAEWTKALPETFNTSLALLRLPPLPDIPEPLRGQFVAHLRVAFLGDDSEGARLLAPMRGVAEPMIDTVGRMPYTQLDNIHQDPDHPVPAYEGSTLLRHLGPGPVDTILEYAGPGADCPLLQVEIRLMGGALSRNASDAVGGRDAAYALIMIGIMVPPFADLVPGAMRELVEAVAPYGTGGSLVNLHGVPTDARDRARPWSAEAFERLQRAKATYDPANLLRFGHAVPALDPV